MSKHEKKISIGIVGCGNISDTHAKAILDSKEGTLVSAFSRSEKNMNRFCSKWNISGFTSYEEFFTSSDLDAVSICTPTGTHLEYGLKAAEYGKHVIVEKPIEITVERGKKLINACRNNNVKLAVIYQNRCHEEAQNLKQALNDKKIGKILMTRASVKWYRDQSYYKDSNWRGTFKLDGGGAVINQSIHTIDLLIWLAGEIKSVYAITKTFTHDMEAEDNSAAIFEFYNGAVGVFEGSTSIIPPQKRRIEVNGSKGTAILEGDRYYLSPANAINSDSNWKDESGGAGASSPMAGMSHDNHRKQYDQILSAMKYGQEPPVSGEESLKSLAVVEAIYKSANSGNPVNVNGIEVY